MKGSNYQPLWLWYHTKHSLEKPSEQQEQGILDFLFALVINCKPSLVV